MRKKAKKKMAKAALPKGNPNGSGNTKRALKKAIRDEREIVALCGRLRRATKRADQSLAELGISYGVRAAALDSSASGH